MIRQDGPPANIWEREQLRESRRGLGDRGHEPRSAEEMGRRGEQRCLDSNSRTKPALHVDKPGEGSHREGTSSGTFTDSEPLPHSGL